MRKVLSYIVLTLTAIIGLHSVYQIYGTTAVIREANAEIAKTMAEQSQQVDDFEFYGPQPADELAPDQATTVEAE
jgi:spore germination protein GerM